MVFATIKLIQSKSSQYLNHVGNDISCVALYNNQFSNSTDELHIFITQQNLSIKIYSIKLT